MSHAAPPSPPRTFRIAAACVIMLGLTAGALVLWMTRNSIGLSTDSRWYAEMARTLHLYGRPLRMNYDGTTSAQSHYPPGYPVFLAIGLNFIATPAEAGRYVNAVAMFVSTLLIAIVAWQATRSSARSVFAAILFVLAVGTWQTGLFLWSEPTFQVLMLGAIVCCGQRLTGARWWWLAIAGLCAGFGCVVRYAGIAVVISGVVAIVFSSRKERRWSRRLRDGFVFAAFAIALPLVWVMWYTRQLGSSAAREPSLVTWMGWPKLLEGLATIGEWIWYGQTPSWLGYTLGTSVLAGVGSIGARSWRSLKTSPTLAMPLAYLLIYPPFLLLSITCFDAATPLDRRILFPLEVMAIVVVASSSGRSRTVPVLRLGMSETLMLRGLASVLMLGQLVSAAIYLGNVREAGLGYGSLGWQRLPVIRCAKSLPADVMILTNNAEVLELAADRRVMQLMRFEPAQFTDAARASELQRLKAALPAGSYVVMIKAHPSALRQVSLKELQRALNLKGVETDAGGSVWIVQNALDGVTP